MRRRAGFLFVCSAVIPIAVLASTAWACGALTTLSSSEKVAAPNQTISLSGRNFAPVGTFTPVEIRWNSRTGPKLNTADIVPTTGGAIDVNVKVPATAKPGWYVVNATQFNASTGVPKSGSPGRTTIRVAGAAVAGAAPWGESKPTGSGGPGSPDLPLPGVLLSVALLATGIALVARDKGRKATRPALSA